MAIAKSKAEFEKAAEGLPHLPRPDLSAEVVCIEPIGAEYFRDSSKQRCIVRLNGKLYISEYE